VDEVLLKRTQKPSGNRACERGARKRQGSQAKRASSKNYTEAAATVSELYNKTARMPTSSPKKKKTLYKIASKLLTKGRRPQQVVSFAR
jgi:hypothetical protein